MLTTQLLLIGLAFFAISTLYSSVGFGGGSSYLAILALFLPDDFLLIKTTALLCNLVVVCGSSWLFIKEKLLDWKKVLPLVICSVPLAFWGARVNLSQHQFFVFLGCVLALSGFLILVQIFLRPSAGNVRNIGAMGNISLGAGAGFLSGLVGIGGGILISPVLHLLRWDLARKIAALASFFILVNSVSGLAGQLSDNKFRMEWPLTFVLLVAVLLGGQLGTRLSLRFIKPNAIKGLTGLLVGYIGIKLVLKHTANIDI